MKLVSKGRSHHGRAGSPVLQITVSILDQLLSDVSNFCFCDFCAVLWPFNISPLTSPQNGTEDAKMT